ncbi:flagellar export chaperone FlgN [Pseudoalteromonas sp. NBT06-2]|uniref:flagellar export chaperone FlgN n=1 Tax=Pseudoalteromonas sp. NBT06-2 TaxID=2025950 RepID=UPI001483C570|nr:flagellar export chaperone FlgN [Pseudoalteromonas sp. NBT06-2]
MIEQNAIQNIQQSLIEQKQNLDALWVTLQNELEAINTRNSNALENSAKEKVTILNKISILDQKLINSPLAQIKNSIPSIKEDISAINELLSNCKQQNDLNAHAAHQTQIAVKKVTDILLGSIKSLTYDNKGKSQAGTLLSKGIKA